MARKVERWQARDGSLHETERGAKQHEATGKFECPKCRGLGRMNGEPRYESILDEEATGYGGFFANPVYEKAIVGYEQVPCDVCNGQGWTAEKKEPVTKTTIVGWK